MLPSSWRISLVCALLPMGSGVRNSDCTRKGAHAACQKPGRGEIGGRSRLLPTKVSGALTARAGGVQSAAMNDQTLPPAGTAAALVAEARARFESDLAGAREQAGRALELARAEGDAATVVDAHVLLGECERVLGDHA